MPSFRLFNAEITPCFYKTHGTPRRVPWFAHRILSPYESLSLDCSPCTILFNVTFAVFRKSEDSSSETSMRYFNEYCRMCQPQNFNTNQNRFLPVHFQQVKRPEVSSNQCYNNQLINIYLYFQKVCGMITSKNTRNERPDCELF